MSATQRLDSIPPDWPECAVAVGVFDGVHWGHHAIVQALLARAREAKVRAVAMTFDRHPAELLAPTRAPEYINTLDQRIELLKAAGVETVVVAQFNPELANLTHEQFLKGVLRGTLKAREIVVGANFCFGRGRAGDIRYLTTAAPVEGFRLTVVPAVIVNDGPVSSTRIRALVSRGDVTNAAKLLGRRFALRGRVVAGRQVGRTLGFPTANIETAPRQLIPAIGVYSVEAAIGGTVHSGVCSIGTRPTFGAGGARTVEVHLTGFQGNIYGEILDVVFCRRIRDEMTFETPEQLIEQIKSDLERAAGACD